MKPWVRSLATAAMVSSLVLLGAVAALGLVVMGLARDLPRLPEDPAVLAIRPGTEIYAASGERIFSFNSSRQWTPLERMAPWIVPALLATEDVSFYSHAGIDLRGILGALWANLRRGYGHRGGSTLTQQLVKRLFFSADKTLRRKLSEMLLALQLEALYAREFPGTVVDSQGSHPAYKDRLLELYLNTVFFGANAYGISDAAQVYFGTSPAALSLPQAALLMGLINAPSAYNPLQRPARATRRLQHVLQRLQAAGYLPSAQRRTYAGMQVSQLLDPRQTPRNPTPYWVEAIKTEVAQRWGTEVLRHGSLRIHTTLDMRLQRLAEKAVERGLTALDTRLGFVPYTQATPEQRRTYVQAALVCLAPRSGQVRAMVGGRDIFVSYYNRALTARRQPGSGFKPIAYLAALEAGTITPLSLVMDVPRRYVIDGHPWTPRDFGGEYMGLVTAAWGLVRSANSVAVQISSELGPQRVVAMARRLGFHSPIGAYMSVALGVSEVTVLEMASAYGVLATSGLHVEPSLVDSVVDGTGRRLFARAPRIRQAVSPEHAYQVLQLLRLVVDRGTGRRVRDMGMQGPVAGKTGTTNDNTDAWFTGCTPDLATSLWVGFDDRRGHRLVDTAGRQLTGGSGAAPIWADFMRRATPEKEATADFPRPPAVRLVAVDPLTGMEFSPLPDSSGNTAPLARIPLALLPEQAPNSARAVMEFLEATAPAEVDPALRAAVEARALVDSSPQP